MDRDKVNILLVDDKPEKLLALEAVLEDLKQNVVRAYSGREALRALLAQDFAVILLDVNMPGMDGFETAEMVRARRKTAHTPIIFITSHVDEIHSMRGYALGDPREEETKLGPMQSVQARDEIHAQVTQSIANGARLLLGGDVPDRPGAWYPATVLVDVTPGQPAYDEEVFGPVAAIIVADDEAAAIRIANASEYGLGSGVLTGDVDRGRRIAAEELAAGLSFVNENVRSDPRMPFGGVKHSGYGRECSAFGIREFTNIKSVHVRGLGGGGSNRGE